MDVNAYEKQYNIKQTLGKRNIGFIAVLHFKVSVGSSTMSIARTLNSETAHSLQLSGALYFRMDSRQVYTTGEKCFCV